MHEIGRPSFLSAVAGFFHWKWDKKTPEIQYQAYTDYALNTNSKGGDACEDAYDVCTRIFNQIMSIACDLNYYDNKKKCQGDLCYDFSAVETSLNLKSVRDALGVGNRDFVSCSSTVYYAMVTDWMRNYEVGIPALLEVGIRLLVYAGDYDLICNWIGNSNWVHAMAWSGQKEFGAAPMVPFVIDGVETGQLKSHGPLSFLKVHNAGHMVPMDQLKASLQMLQNWMQGKLTPSKAADKVSPK
ncbi:Serine carboxypeptidase 3 [Hibiscus syriacus]|uniref:Serine carboxypeptidase 3 n=1 Tax=Hibiscus syriacus TaxID=106335 RepID=A0A6A3CZ35_HIBSY|nr:Serine carboxypeptidase 3 [Hibiscus syriacus]